MDSSNFLEHIAARIQRGDVVAESEFVDALKRGLRFLIARQLGPEGLDDALQNTFLIAIRALRQGELRDLNCIASFVRVIAQRQVQNEIQQRVRSRKSTSCDDLPLQVFEPSSEDRVYASERAELGRRALDACSKSEREILRRFYLLEQSQEQICREMNLTLTQFRLKKSRAKDTFGRIGRKLVAASPKPILTDHSVPGGINRRLAVA